MKSTLLQKKAHSSLVSVDGNMLERTGRESMKFELDLGGQVHLDGHEYQPLIASSRFPVLYEQSSETKEVSYIAPLESNSLESRCAHHEEPGLRSSTTYSMMYYLHNAFL